MRPEDKAAYRRGATVVVPAFVLAGLYMAWRIHATSERMAREADDLTREVIESVTSADAMAALVIGYCADAGAGSTACGAPPPDAEPQ